MFCEYLKKNFRAGIQSPLLSSWSGKLIEFPDRSTNNEDIVMITTEYNLFANKKLHNHWVQFLAVSALGKSLFLIRLYLKLHFFLSE